MAVILIAILGCFGWLMISRRLTATLALPLAALSIAFVALIPQALEHGLLGALGALLTDVIEEGVTCLSTAIVAVILGAVLAALMSISGAAERLVRYAAEYAGEDRFRMGLVLLLAIAVLFTTLGGLGAVILVATIALPLMFSLGFEPKVAGGLFLLGLSLGGCLNPINWALYKDVLLLNETQIVPYAVTLAAIFFFVACAFLLTHVSDRSNRRNQALALLSFIAAAAAIGYFSHRWPAEWLTVKHCVAGALLILVLVLVTLLLIRLVALVSSPSKKHTGWLGDPGNWLTVAAALLPLLLLLWSTLHANIIGEGNARISIGILTALSAGIVFCALASLTHDGAAANRVMRALFEGVTSGGPAVVLLLGIGMLLKAASLPVVAASFEPYLRQLPVDNLLGFVAAFSVLSPLALYRGPLNLYGMGSGVVGIISGSAILTSSLIMVAFFSVGMLQGVCDPTNTHNAWIANFCKVPVAELTRLTFLWVLLIVVLGLLAGGLMFRPAFG